MMQKGCLIQGMTNSGTLKRKLLLEVCQNIEIEPRLQPLTGESMFLQSANTEDSALLDVWGYGTFIRRRQGSDQVSRGEYVYIILWSYVCPNVCFKPTQFEGEISPSFGKELYFTEIYNRTILISQCSGFFLKRACR